MTNPVYVMNMVNLFLNVAIQSSIIFIPLLGSQLGASDFQVGLIGAAYGGAFLVSSLYSGRQSDRYGKMGFVRTGLVFCIVAFAAQQLAHHLPALALVRAGVGLALGVTMAALVAYAFESGSDMGMFSSYGSLGWIAGALIAAWLKNFDTLFTISSLCCAAAFLFSLLLPRQESPGTCLQKGKAPRLGAVIRQGFPVYLAVFARHLGATAVWIILPLYFASLGFDRFWVGILWGINFVVQFIVMRFMERFNPNSIFTLGQFLSIGVFATYAFARHLWPLIAVQALIGVAWSCLYVGALLLVLRTGEDRGTASGIFQATLNLCGAVGPFLGGVIAQIWGYSGVMLFAAALGVAGLAVAIPRVKQQETD